MLVCSGSEIARGATDQPETRCEAGWEMLTNQTKPEYITYERASENMSVCAPPGLFLDTAEEAWDDRVGSIDAVRCPLTQASGVVSPG
jgi:hypothetical protein